MKKYMDELVSMLVGGILRLPSSGVLRADFGEESSA